MTLGRQITAFVLLVAWCFATAHLWMAHAGERTFEVSGEEHTHDWHGHHHEDDHHNGDHHDEEEQPGEESHHHHGLGTATRATIFQELTIAAPMTAMLWEAIVQALSCASADEPQPEIFGSPPDERSSGYLFVIQTAHPVRGPSLVV